MRLVTIFPRHFDYRMSSMLEITLFRKNDGEQIEQNHACPNSYIELNNSSQSNHNISCQKFCLLSLFKIMIFKSAEN